MQSKSTGMDEEIECLAAIYGDENIYFDSVSKTVKVQMDLNGISFDLVMQLSNSYPSDMPMKLTVRGTSSLSDYCSSISLHIKDCLKSYLGEPYLLNAVMALQDFVAENSPESRIADSELDIASVDSQHETWITVLKVDHMRNRQKYLKHLKKWSEELGVGVSLFILKGTRYVVLLEGDKGDVDQYLVNWKTQCVDVDSKGKPCKEKMLTICRSKRTSSIRNRSFALREADNLFDFTDSLELFEDFDVTELKALFT